MVMKQSDRFSLYVSDDDSKVLLKVREDGKIRYRKDGELKTKKVDDKLIEDLKAMIKGWKDEFKPGNKVSRG